MLPARVAGVSCRFLRARRRGGRSRDAQRLRLVVPCGRSGGRFMWSFHERPGRGGSMPHDQRGSRGASDGDFPTYFLDARCPADWPSGSPPSRRSSSRLLLAEVLAPNCWCACWRWHTSGCRSPHCLSCDRSSRLASSVDLPSTAGAASCMLPQALPSGQPTRCARPVRWSCRPVRRPTVLRFARPRSALIVRRRGASNVAHGAAGPARPPAAVPSICASGVWMAEWTTRRPRPTLKEVVPS